MFYPFLKPHISPSALSTWYGAKQSFIKSYFEGEHFKGNSATDFGKVVHGLIEGGLFPAKKVFDQSEVQIIIPLENGVNALGTPDSFTLVPTDDTIQVVDYKTGKEDGWSATEIAGDLKVKFTCWLALQASREAGFNPLFVKFYIESFQTFWNPRKKKLELMPNDESELYEFQYTAVELDAFTLVINKTVNDVNEAYTKWKESTDEFVDKESVKEFGEVQKQITELEARAEVLKERIGEQMTFGNKDNFSTDVGTFYFTTKEKWSYPPEMPIGYEQFTLKTFEDIGACVKSAKLTFETENKPVSSSKSLGFRAKKEKK